MFSYQKSKSYMYLSVSKEKCLLLFNLMFSVECSRHSRSCLSLNIVLLPFFTKDFKTNKHFFIFFYFFIEQLFLV